MGARWTWNTLADLADNACSHHIPSLAPAVALPAPRHDRRRTGAAGSPPGGFPFVEFRHAVVECVPVSRMRRSAQRCAADPGPPRPPDDPRKRGLPDFRGLNPDPG